MFDFKLSPSNSQRLWADDLDKEGMSPEAIYSSNLILKIHSVKVFTSETARLTSVGFFAKYR